MAKKNQDPQRPLSRGLAGVIALFVTLLVGQAKAGDYEDIDISPAADCDSADPLTFGAKVSGVTQATIPVADSDGTVFLAVKGPTCTETAPNNFGCPSPSGKFKVSAPTDATAQAAAITTINFPGLNATDLAVNLEGNFNVTATDSEDGNKTCTQQYHFHMVPEEAMGGWGDPHLTTFDGTHYDFQSAGEFTALKSDRLEIQTRQAAVPTATVPITNAYTGITHCVALFSAVATRVGSTRVTLQPKFGSEPDRRSMQLRVNGNPVELTQAGIELSSGGKFDGRIKQADAGAIEIVAADGAQIVLTPGHWDAHDVWYLNINVFQSSAKAGTMGLIHEGDWLPQLPDGTALGPKPESAEERYQQLYETFADAWRVTNANSLFDYEAGTNTATFTLDEWPRNNPQSCGIHGQTPAQPTTQQAAEQACAAVTDPAQKADCVFDVAITGNLDFAKSYEVMQGFKPQGPGWQTHVVFPSPDEVTPPPSNWKELLKKWWWLILLILILLIIILNLSRKKSTP